MKRQRGARGNITQKELATQANVGIQLVRELERGVVARRNLNNLAAISTVLWGDPEVLERIGAGESAQVDGVAALRQEVADLREFVAEQLGQVLRRLDSRRDDA